MGVLHIPRKITERSIVWDLSSILENQTMLTHHLFDLLRMSAQNNQQILTQYRTYVNQNWARINVSEMSSLDPESLLAIYSEQYNIIEMALSIGRSHTQSSNDGQAGSSLSEIVDRQDSGSSLYAYHRAMEMATRRLTPQGMRAEFNRVLQECKVGDIIDLAGYRGTGYFLIVDKMVGNRLTTVRSRGQYGCHLPKDAWPIIQQFGFEFFEKADVWACYLPRDTEVMVGKSDDKFTVDCEHSCLIAWLHGGDNVEIDGISYTCEVLPNEPQ